MLKISITNAYLELIMKEMSHVTRHESYFQARPLNIIDILVLNALLTNVSCSDETALYVPLNRFSLVNMTY